MRNARTLTKTAMVAVACLGLASACQPTQTREGHDVTATQLAQAPEPGPDLFGPLDETGPASAPPPAATSAARSGNSARVGRPLSTQAPTQAATQAPPPAQAPATGNGNLPPQISSLPPPPAPAAEQGFVTTATGLRYRDIIVGHGAPPQPGQTVFANYQGWLYENGRRGDLFDRSRGAPFSFTLGAGQVIRGWDEAFATMRPGGKRVLIIPPHLGYGTAGAGGLIPPNATLMFEVDLIEVR